MSDDIGKLADEVIGRMKTTEELKTVPFEMYARVLDRAVKAEAERDAMREAIRKIRATDNITAVWHIADGALNPPPPD